MMLLFFATISFIEVITVWRFGIDFDLLWLRWWLLLLCDLYTHSLASIQGSLNKHQHSGLSSEKCFTINERHSAAAAAIKNINKVIYLSALSLWYACYARLCFNILELCRFWFRFFFSISWFFQQKQKKWQFKSSYS
jgi:hypothetical protein